MRGGGFEGVGPGRGARWRAVVGWGSLAVGGAGCSATQMRVDVPAAVVVGAPVEAVAYFDCVPGVAGCGPAETVIERLAVEPAAGVAAVDRRDRSLVFTPTVAGALRVVFEARVDGERRREVAAVEALAADGVMLEGCGPGAAMGAGVEGAARFFATAGGRRLGTRAAVVVASSNAIVRRVGETYAIDGTRARAGEVVRLTSPLVPGWSAEVAVVSRDAIDGARPGRDEIAVGETVEVPVAFGAGRHTVCASLEVPASVAVETPETCAVLWPELRGRTGVRVRGRAAGACRLRFSVGRRPVAVLQVRR